MSARPPVIGSIKNLQDVKSALDRIRSYFIEVAAQDASTLETILNELAKGFIVSKAGGSFVSRKIKAGTSGNISIINGDGQSGDVIIESKAADLTARLDSIEALAASDSGPGFRWF